MCKVPFKYSNILSSLNISFQLFKSDIHKTEREISKNNL